MKADEIDQLIASPDFKRLYGNSTLVGTHISWVLLCDQKVFKIKKPIQYSFLDFSTLPMRRFYCQQELKLNRRLAGDMYERLGIVIKKNGELNIIESEPPKDIEVVDYAVVMKKQDTDWQMDKLVRRGAVSKEMLIPLIDILVSFHKNTDIVTKKDITSVQHNFEDIADQKAIIREQLGDHFVQIVETALERSTAFIKRRHQLLQKRSDDGFVRDCHGDLHTRNIFLNPKKPVVFDCIEFNDDIRQIDVLNELAFFCMDLEAFGQSTLSEYFIITYNKSWRVMRNAEEEQLFVYYKAYRANVRAKVNALRAQSAEENNSEALEDCALYLNLMNQYINELQL